MPDLRDVYQRHALRPAEGLQCAQRQDIVSVKNRSGPGRELHRKHCYVIPAPAIGVRLLDVFRAYGEPVHMQGPFEPGLPTLPPDESFHELAYYRSPGSGKSMSAMRF